MKLYNTLARKKEKFQPINPPHVGLYSCGPTVYNFAHIGNLRAFLFADVLKRTLIQSGFEVKHIMNITDVGHLTGDRDMGEDKLAAAAKRMRKTAWEIASYYTDAFLSDIKELNIILADKYPKATDHIKDMIALIADLGKQGFTYRTSDGIYFDTAKLQDYGKLAQLDISGLREGARVEINNEKRNPTDFALWKFSPQDEKRDMEWDSPWGLGFPGWHIECSAMSAKYLGQPFDIHTGGIDHIPVHHTNEIAQSEAAFGKPLAHYWLHSEFVVIGEGRIGKSEGNAVTLADLTAQGYSALAYRYFALQGHYRSKLNFSLAAMDSARNTLNSLYEKIADYDAPKVGCAEYEERFSAAMQDDLDTPTALSVMWEMLNSDYPGEAKMQSLLQMDKILGLSIRETWERLHQPVPEEVSELAWVREKKRQAQDWVGADELRKQIDDLGYEVNDTGSGPKIIRKI